MEQYADQLAVCYARHWDHSKNLLQSPYEFAEISAIASLDDFQAQAGATRPLDPPNVRGLSLMCFRAGQVDIEDNGGDPVEGDISSGFHFEAHADVTEDEGTRERADDEYGYWVCIPHNYPCTSTLDSPSTDQYVSTPCKILG